MEPAQNYIKWRCAATGVMSELKQAKHQQGPLPGALHWWFNKPHTYSTETATRKAAALRLQRMSAQEMTDLGQVIGR